MVATTASWLCCDGMGFDRLLGDIIWKSRYLLRENRSGYWYDAVQPTLALESQ